MDVGSVGDVLSLVLLGICLYTDVRRKKIPNWATLPAVALGLGLNGLGGGWTGLKASGMGLGVGFGALFVLFALGWMGGGDVKLMAAVGAIKGYPFVLSALVYSILVGGFIGLAVLIWRRRLLGTMRSIGLFLLSRAAWATPPHELDQQAMQPIPFGVAIVAGTIWAGLMARLGEPTWPVL